MLFGEPYVLHFMHSQTSMKMYTDIYKQVLPFSEWLSGVKKQFACAKCFDKRMSNQKRRTIREPSISIDRGLTVPYTASLNRLSSTGMHNGITGQGRLLSALLTLLQSVAPRLRSQMHAAQ